MIYDHQLLPGKLAEGVCCRNCGSFVRLRVVRVNAHTTKGRFEWRTAKGDFWTTVEPACLEVLR